MGQFQGAEMPSPWPVAALSPKSGNMLWLCHKIVVGCMKWKKTLSEKGKIQRSQCWCFLDMNSPQETSLHCCYPAPVKLKFMENLGSHGCIPMSSFPSEYSKNTGVFISCRTWTGCSQTIKVCCWKSKNILLFQATSPLVHSKEISQPFWRGQKGFGPEGEMSLEKLLEKSPWTGVEKRHQHRKQENHCPCDCSLAKLGATAKFCFERKAPRDLHTRWNHQPCPAQLLLFITYVCPVSNCVLRTTSCQSKERKITGESKIRTNMFSPPVPHFTRERLFIAEQPEP